MTINSSHQLIVLAGPSCVGKTPLVKALAKVYPNLYRNLQNLVLYTSRDKRKGESDGVDYHYRSRKEVELVGKKNQFLLIQARGDLQAVDLQQLRQLLSSGDVLFEGNTFTGKALINHARQIQTLCLNVFVSPLSKTDILNLKATNSDLNFEGMVFEMMKRKLVRRTQNFGQKLSKRISDNIEIRASETYEELKQAWQFSYVLPNHDGEDSDNWQLAPIPLGDALKALHALALLLEGKISPPLEQWRRDLVP
jgi:guanylate kinase